MILVHTEHSIDRLLLQEKHWELQSSGNNLLCDD